MAHGDDFSSILNGLPPDTLVALLPHLLGGQGGAGGSAGDGGAGGGGGGAAGGTGGTGGTVIVNYAPIAPAELLDWLTPINGPLATALASDEHDDRRAGWERFRDWLGSQALTIPANVVGGVIAAMLLPM